MRVIVTGASGFIASHLVRGLSASGHEVFALSRSKIAKYPNTKSISADISNPAEYIEVVKRFHPEMLFHLAWEGIPDYSELMCQKNLYASKTLIDQVSDIPSIQKIFVAGSCWEYEDHKGSAKEDLDYQPNSDFTSTKHKIRKYTEQICQKNDIRWYWGRLFYVYGPGQHSTSLIPYLMSCCRENVKPIINNPEGSNDFIYIDDVVEGLLGFLEKPVPSGIYNFGTGKSSSVRLIQRCITEIFGSNNQRLQCDFSYGVQKGKSKVSLVSDTTKTSQYLGWNAKNSIFDGILKTTSKIKI